MVDNRTQRKEEERRRIRLGRDGRNLNDGTRREYTVFYVLLIGNSMAQNPSGRIPFGNASVHEGAVAFSADGDEEDIVHYLF